MTMTEMASVNSHIIFGSIEYSIPEELEIEPKHIYDDKEKVYRISLGRADLTEDEVAMYQPLFIMLDKHRPFIENIKFITGNKLLHFYLALLTRTVNEHGTFYDIEAMVEDVVYSERNIDAV